MGNRIYVGNLSFNATADTVREAFVEFGEVTDVHLVMDRDTGRSRGFAFVTMATDALAQNAISAMNNKVLDGRPLRVNEAEARGDNNGARRGGDRERRSRF
jgi:RNA recognition motif-containing protein